MSPNQPSCQDAPRTQAAESKKISDLIEQGYDFKEEMGRSPLKRLLDDDHREIMDKNRRATKAGGK
jgi:hypothetical protein